VRDQPFDTTFWELEAARRREVIESHFGIAYELRASRGSRSEGTLDPVRRLVGWIAALARGGGAASTNRVDRVPGCQHGLGAIERGS
jgi:hypothetical protein